MIYYSVLVIPWILRDEDTMVSKSCVFICICTGLFVAFLSKALAYRRTSDVDEFMVEDKRTRMRQNYVVQRALDNEMSDMDYVGPRYSLDPVPARTEPEELPEFIVDYANMIRNDIILLDNSVETRTRKRGNIKVQEHGQEIDEFPCSCENGLHLYHYHEFTLLTVTVLASDGVNDLYGELYSSSGGHIRNFFFSIQIVYTVASEYGHCKQCQLMSVPFDLTGGLQGSAFPEFVENKTCVQGLCKSPNHSCEKSISYIPVIRKLNGIFNKIDHKRNGVPNELKHKWFNDTIPVITGCLCKSKYLIKN